jgi:hypothetical protein
MDTIIFLVFIEVKNMVQNYNHIIDTMFDVAKNVK